MSSYAKYKDLGEKEEPKSNQPVFPVMEIKNLTQKKQLIESNIVCVIKVWAEWCGPCKQVAKKYADLSRMYSKPGFCLLVQEESDLGLSPSVKGIPAFLFYKNGQFVGDIMGPDIKSVEIKLKSLLGN
jgi:thioredoxin 1